LFIVIGLFNIVQLDNICVLSGAVNLMTGRIYAKHGPYTKCLLKLTCPKYLSRFPISGPLRAVRRTYKQGGSCAFFLEVKNIFLQNKILHIFHFFSFFNFEKKKINNKLYKGNFKNIVARRVIKPSLLYAEFSKKRIRVRNERICAGSRKPKQVFRLLKIRGPTIQTFQDSHTLMSGVISLELGYRISRYPVPLHF